MTSEVLTMSDLYPPRPPGEVKPPPRPAPPPGVRKPPTPLPTVAIPPARHELEPATPPEDSEKPATDRGQGGEQR